jgi:hypothetical protein
MSHRDFAGTGRGMSCQPSDIPRRGDEAAAEIIVKAAGQYATALFSFVLQVLCQCFKSS